MNDHLAGFDHCHVVDIPTPDGDTRAIAVHSCGPMTPEAAAALGQIVDIAERHLAAQHPHAGITQELMLATAATLRALPPSPALNPIKDRMRAAAANARDALREAGR
jgi:hypothetical protein